MAVLVVDLLSELQGVLIEPEDGGATWPSGLWTAAEVRASFNQRQDEFMRRTQVTLASAQIVPAIGNPLADLPPDWIATAEVLYDDGATTRELPRAEVWQSDRAQPTWQGTAGSPLVYSDADGEALQITLQPASSVASTLQLLYVAIADPYDGTFAQQLLEVPDEAAPTILWGMLEDLLKKLGRAEDLARAAYCNSRWEEGILSWQLALEGVF